jgi:hypothetical protein
MLEDRLTPDETSVQNQQLIQDLQRIHDTRAADAQSRARIRERLLKDHATAIPNVDHTSETTPEVKIRSQRAKETNVKLIYSLYEKRSRRQRLSVIAAAVLVAVLIGSLVLLVRGRQADLGNGAGTFQLRQGWTQIAIYSGTGSKILTGLDIEPAPVWGYTAICSGSGSPDFKMMGVKWIIGGELCQPTYSTQIAPQTILFATSPVKLQTIKVTADASMVWHLQIVQEVKQPTLRLGSEWVGTVGLSGNGSDNPAGGVGNITKPDGQIITPRTLGIVFVCIGEGKGYIQFTPNVGRITLPPCDGQPRLKVIRFPVATYVEQYQVLVTGDIVWQAMVVGCADEQKCGNIPAINVFPTPVPASDLPYP